MRSQYQHYIVKDSLGGATLRNFPGTHLTVQEPDIFALDIEQAPNLQHLEIAALKPGKTPHLRLFNVPALQQVDIGPTVMPAIIYHAGRNDSTSLTISGNICAFDADINGIGFALSQPENDYWRAFRMLTPAQAQQFKGQNELLLVLQTGHNPIADLTLRGQNDWVLHGLDIATLHSETTGQLQLHQVPALHSLTLHKPCRDLQVNQASNLQHLYGQGGHAKLQHEQHGTGELHIHGEWDSVALNTPKLKRLIAPAVKNLLVVDARQLEQADLALNTPVECLGMMPNALNQSTRFYFHEATVKNMLMQLSQGQPDILPSLLNILPQAAYRNQVRHSLNALKAMCDLFVPAETIWLTRNELLVNNLRIYGRRRLLLDESKPTSNRIIWSWSFPKDLYQEALLADLKIWEYCSNSLAPAFAYRATMAKTDNAVEYLPVLLHCISAADTSPVIQQLAAELLASYSRNDNQRSKLREQLNLPHNLNRLLYGIKKTAGQPAEQQQLISCAIQLMNEEHFMQHIGQFYDQHTDLVRGELVRIANAPNDWFSGFFNHLWMLPREQNQLAMAFRQKIMLLALSPANTTTLTAQEAY